MKLFSFLRTRANLFGIAIVTWLALVALLLQASYVKQEQLAFERLEYKSEVVSIQFDRHWQNLQENDESEQKTYLKYHTQRFRPFIHLTILNDLGKLESSTLNNLDQLSYSPALNMIKMYLDRGQHCFESINGFIQGSIYVCAFKHSSVDSYLISTLNQQSIFEYWLQQSGYFIVTIVLGLLVFSFLYWLLSNRHKQILAQQSALTGAMEKQGSEFKRLLSNLPGLVYRMHLKSRQLVYVSPGSIQLIGYPPEYLIERHISPIDLIDSEDEEHFDKRTRAAHFSLKPFELVYRIRTQKGERKWVLDRGQCFQDDNGDYFIEGVILDITERELVRQQIEYLAEQDPLTELFNRYRFNDELVGAVDDANRKHEHFAMLFIDLDRFKNINDSLGHQLGDRLIRKAAARLQSAIPESHFLARMGGDEFVILMRWVNNISEVEALAERINRELRKPFNIDTYQLRTSCSIGISLCPDDSNQSHILWRYADTAMYQVKSRGGDNYQFFTREMGDQVQHRITIEHSFISAIENSEFELFYQPQVDILSGELKGAEALIRWKHPKLGMISPAEFIPIAEETGFIHDLGDWILNQALDQLEKWQTYKPDMTLAVNISALQINQEFPMKLKEFIEVHSIHENTLELEITESLLMENISFVQQLLHEVCEQDVTFAIDDFGTGYSSLSYLRYLPINKLKIDRAFVKNLETNQDDVSMVKAIIAMGKNLGMKVLAEGIETESQLEILKTQGCDTYQGYLFSPPVDTNTFYERYIYNSEGDIKDSQISS